MSRSRENTAVLRNLPSVAVVLEALADLRTVNQAILTALVRREVAAWRKTLLEGGETRSREDLTAGIQHRVRIQLEGRPQPLINATGIVLHTGFGRAPLHDQQLARVSARMSGYTNLEFDLNSGSRGNRLDHVAFLLNTLTGAEAAVVVNNNAAAVLLTLNALAEGREVIVSRGQEVEIGGSFRIPDIVEKSGAIIREVGTTNRTHLKDYEDAVGKNTGGLLWVHTSNYRVQGFTHAVALNDLAELGRRKRLPLIADLGSGALQDLTTLGLPSEPTVSSVIKQGADVVTFSGDKLLGGPQAGLIVGKRRWIRKITRDPIYRAVRCDKWTLALLWDALVHTEDNLTHRLLSSESEVLQRRAEKILEQIRPEIIARWSITVRKTTVEAGSGSLPTHQLPSAALAFQQENTALEDLAGRLRSGSPPVVGFIHRGTFFLDLKAVLPEQDARLIQALNALDA
ncbi:MAG: L-seryl-tRNA(Sec) selenium transferase [FCB group bacterium]|nr:L-seryl-tRNA(Sec) selenium transferase [FCB group bacterium]